MYQPRAFVGTDPAQLDALFAADPFVTLLTNDGAGEPFASHLPVLYHRDGDRIRIEGHWAKPNPQAKHAGDALLIVHGRGRQNESHPNIVRSYVAKWLAQFEQVQAFCRALPRDGGEGACYVTLRKSAQAKAENFERHAKRSR